MDENMSELDQERIEMDELWLASEMGDKVAKIEYDRRLIGLCPSFATLLADYVDYYSQK